MALLKNGCQRFLPLHFMAYLHMVLSPDSLQICHRLSEILTEHGINLTNFSTFFFFFTFVSFLTA